MDVDGLRILTDVPDEPVKWFWDGRVPLGEVTILEGHPGTNKSSLTDDLAARLTQGKPLPCAAEDAYPHKGGALFLIGEDSISKTVKARLVAAGADLRLVGVLESIAIPADLLTVEKAVRALDAKLVVVDTLNDFLTVNVLGNQAVRKALRPLRELASKTNSAVVVLRHFIKSSSSHSLLRGGGSVGITAVARSQLKLYLHPEDPHMRVLIQDKSNLGPLSPPLLFEVGTSESGAVQLAWHGECELTVEDLERKHRGSPKLEAAQRFLLDRLANAPQEVNALLEQARGAFSKRTLDEAKRLLGIKTVREGRGKEHKVFWSL
jgi:hypothetical protein